MALKDSGNRREIESGAVRDIQEGKGRCDLLPLDILSQIFSMPGMPERSLLRSIYGFQDTGESEFLIDAITSFIYIAFEGDKSTAILEVAKHFEDGCQKYGENNWKMGIPANIYIDSAIRHFLKYKRGDTDERHDRAFLWNLICCAWTCEHIPELNSYAKKAGGQS